MNHLYSSNNAWHDIIRKADLNKSLSEWIDFPIYSLAHQQVGGLPLPSCDPPHLEGMMLELENLASLVFWVISLSSHSHPWSGLLTFSFCFKMCSKSQESKRKLWKFILHYWIERHHGENMSIFHPIKGKLNWEWERGKIGLKNAKANWQNRHI